MKFLLLILIAVGCSQVQVVKGPDGTEHKLVNCSYIEHCYEVATKTCGKYQIINSSSAADQDMNNKVTNSHKLLIKCVVDAK